MARRKRKIVVGDTTYKITRKVKVKSADGRPAWATLDPDKAKIEVQEGLEINTEVYWLRHEIGHITFIKSGMSHILGEILSSDLTEDERRDKIEEAVIELWLPAQHLALKKNRLQ